MTLLSGILVVVFALFLVGLAVTIYVSPSRAAQFLNAFASSARAHYTEQVLRLVAGGALVVYAPFMWQPDLFRLFGWVLLLTSIGLLCTPWRWHHRFARWVVPPVIRHMKLYSVGAATLAALLLYGVITGNAA